MDNEERKEVAVQAFVILDALWGLINPSLPVHQKPVHPLGCHRPQIPDRQVLNGIFFVLRTGCQWKALDATGICSGSTIHARFQEWEQDGFFVRLWEAALCDYDELEGLGWSWLELTNEEWVIIGLLVLRPRQRNNGKRQATPCGTRGAMSWRWHTYVTFLSPSSLKVLHVTPHKFTLA